MCQKDVTMIGPRDVIRVLNEAKVKQMIGNLKAGRRIEF
jgi:hypothetical protein